MIIQIPIKEVAAIENRGKCAVVTTENGIKWLCILIQAKFDPDGVPILYMEGKK